MGGITGSTAIVTGAGLSGAGTTLSPLVNSYDPTTVGAIGSVIHGMYIVNTPTSANNTKTCARYASGLSVAGSSIAYDVSFSPSSSGFNGTATVEAGHDLIRSLLSLYASPISFPPNGAQGSYFVSSSSSIGGLTSNVGATVSYSTMSGSWRSMSPFNVSLSNVGAGIGASSDGCWSSIPWVRYA